MNRSAHILLIADEPQNIQTVSAILNEQGYQTSVASDGVQGLALLERYRPDLILLDVTMPGIDGYEVCRRIKNSPAWRDIPVIFLTASKPFSAAELLARVRTHLELVELRQSGSGVVAELFDNVAILFVSIDGFTSLSAKMRPAELLELLNQVFTCFDELSDLHGLEKIKTIGDTYMVAAGLPHPHPDYLNAIARASLQMVESASKITCAYGRISVRAGFHAGPAIAGAIGLRKRAYDVWGNTVNLASRLTSTSEPNRVHVTRDVAETLKDNFTLESRGTIDIKGVGPTDTFFLLG